MVAAERRMGTDWYPSPQKSADVGTPTTHLDSTTYCTRCHRDTTDARDVYYPISDEYIQLCTDCEPDDTAVSPFELWHYPQPTPDQIEAMLEDMARTYGYNDPCANCGEPLTDDGGQGWYCQECTATVQFHD